MGMVDKAIVDRLVASTELMALTANFRNGKAVFAIDPIPPGVEPPFVQVGPTLSDEEGVFGTKNSNGREWVRDIFCYMRALGDDSTVDAMGEIIRGLFHRQHGDINVSGFGVMVAKASGPQVTPTDDTMYGRVVTVTLTAAE